MMTVSCVIDTPVLDSGETSATNGSAAGTSGGAVDSEPTAVPQFEPTSIPSPPTPQATVEPTPTVEATPTPTPPEPTPEPTPTTTTAPDPLPTVTEEANFQPTVIPAGLIAVPVLDTTFRLDEARPILQFGGHSLIYLDEQARSEVDIFTPVAFDDGTPINSYDEVIEFLQTDTRTELEEGDPVTIAGHATRVFEGLGVEQSRAFITDLSQVDEALQGWVPPDQLTLWVVDHPRGTVIVTAEAFDDSNQYSDALDLAANILSTIDFG